MGGYLGWMGEPVTAPSIPGRGLLAVSLSCLVSLAACDMTASGDKPDTGFVTKTAFVKQAEESGHVEFDLRRTPTRAETGIGDGQDIAIFQWRDQRKIETVVLLSGDVRFTFDAAHIDVDARNPAGPPKEVRMQATFDDLDAARGELLRAARVLGDPDAADALGLSAGTVDRWYREHHQGDPKDDYANQVFRGRRHGSVAIEVTASSGGTGSVTVLYSFQLGGP